ncbi:ABC transporter permease [Kiloniella sp. b19]|uniref:ABC transporter permease n=1 Tax=Kiloniella sp. GXU_MW_B19 TaxID=3141326 RepID=UPI0031CFC21C
MNHPASPAKLPWVLRLPGWARIGLVIVLVVTFWDLLVRLTGLPHFILPSPWRVAQALYNNAALIGEHALTTLAEVLLGMLVGTLFGIMTALQLAHSPTARAIMRPVLVFSQAIPVFALAPIFTLWLGYGMASKIAVALLIIYFPVTSAFFDGLVNTPRGYLDQARIMGASRWTILTRVRIPAALPSLGSGLRLAAVYAPIGAVIGEWVGASSGLGYLMLLANGRVKIDLMFASLIVLAFMSVTLHWLVDRLAARKLDSQQ